MNGLKNLKQRLSHNNQEVDTVRNLYLVMKDVGGYSELLNLPITSLNEIIKCIEYFAKEEAKAMKK